MLWLWNFFLDRRQFSYVLVLALIAAGAYSVLKIPKENSPQIIVPYGTVVTALPGASAEDIETLVTNKIENQVSGLNNIDKVTSNSNEGVSVVLVQFNANADVNQSIQDLRDAAAKAVPDLPSDATTPQVSKLDITKQPVLVASISGNLPPLQLSNLGQTVSDQLKKVPGVSEVDIAGVPKREVDVVVNKESLDHYALRITDVMAAIGASNAAAPAGKISMDGVNYSINFKGDITDPEQIKDIAVSAKGGVPVYVRDIANVSNGLAPATTYSRLSMEGKPSEQAISVYIYKQSGASIATVADASRNAIQDMQKTTLSGMKVYISPTTDQGVQINKQLGDLTKTGFETVLLVIAALLLTIGWRESLVAALAIPLSFLISFIGLNASGNTLNFISLFSLILAVGILVDSGIVVTEAIHARMRIYATPMEAARVALKDYAWPLIGGTMATVAVFAPLFFISGIIGKFLAGIPYTIIFVLMASIFVALGVVPLIAVRFTKREANWLEQKQEEYTERVTEWYKETLRSFLQNRRYQNYFIGSLWALFVVFMTLPFVGVIQSIYFPQSDLDLVIVNITTPEGTTLDKTDLVTREVEELLYPLQGVASFQTTVGQSSNLEGEGSNGSNNANITVNLPIGHPRSSTEFQNEIREKLAVVKDADVQVLQLNNGPPSGAPIQLQFKGDNLDHLIAAAENGKHLLASIPGVTSITSSTQNNGTEFDLTIDRGKASALGVNPQIIAQTLRTSINGAKATSITLPNQDIDVVVKLNLNPGSTDPANTTQTTIDSIRNLTVQGSAGPVLLGSILNDSLGVSNSAISHKDKQRIETVSAYPNSKTTTAAVVAQFQKRIGELKLPADVNVSFGGETEDMGTSFSDLIVALLAGILLMFMILIVSFNSIRYTLYLLVIVPLSLIGVFAGLAITGQPISLTAFLGIIALGGVIINHAIILMDSMIQHYRDEPEKTLIDVVVDSSATRLRPIFLTTVTTVIGMIPLAESNAMWGPLAFAVMFGLTFAICLTLVLVPALFYRAPHRKRS